MVAVPNVEYLNSQKINYFCLLRAARASRKETSDSCPSWRRSRKRQTKDGIINLLLAVRFLRILIQRTRIIEPQDIDKEALNTPIFKAPIVETFIPESYVRLNRRLTEKITLKYQILTIYLFKLRQTKISRIDSIYLTGNILLRLRNQ